MKKPLLIAGLALSICSLNAQNSIVYENGDETVSQLHYYSSSTVRHPNPAPTADNQAYPYSTYDFDSINLVEQVKKFDQYDTNSVTKKFDPDVFISTGLVIPGSGEWGNFDFNTYPVMTMDVYAPDTINVMMEVMDKTDSKNTVLLIRKIQKYAVKNVWQTLVFDFSSIAKGTFPVKNEFQIHFSYGHPQNISLYFDNIIGWTSTAVIASVAGADAELAQSIYASPNPATGLTTINYSLKNSDNVTLKVYDMLGQLVQSSDLGQRAAGSNEFRLDVSNFNSGIYNYSLNVGNNVYTKKMMVVK